MFIKYINNFIKDFKTLFSYFACLFLLTACNLEQENKWIPNVIANPESSSSALADNPLPEGHALTNFRSSQITIDTTALTFSGQRVFLKLYHEDGRVLFLGEINPANIFSIPVETLLADELIHYEIFSNHHADNATSGVILL